MAGRPSKWDELDMDNNLHLVVGWARNGLTDKQIAENIGVSESTFHEWKKKYPQLVESLKQSKELADMQVENALFRNATGFEYEEEVATPSGMVVKVKKKQLPQNAAIIFWLKNRKPHEWRDKQSIEHTGNMTHHIDLSHMSDEEVEAELKKLKGQEERNDERKK